MFVTLGKTKAVYLPLTSYRWGNWSPWDHTGYLFVFTPQWSRKQLSIHCQNPWQRSFQHITVKHSFRWLRKHQKEWVCFPISCKKFVLVHKNSSMQERNENNLLWKHCVALRCHIINWGLLTTSGLESSLIESQTHAQFWEKFFKNDCCSYILLTSFAWDFWQCLCALRTMAPLRHITHSFQRGPTLWVPMPFIL